MESTLFSENTRRLGPEVCKYSTARETGRTREVGSGKKASMPQGPLGVLSDKLMVRLVNGSPE
jgi:hypothetical protein